MDDFKVLGLERVQNQVPQVCKVGLCKAPAPSLLSMAEGFVQPCGSKTNNYYNETWYSEDIYSGIHVDMSAYSRIIWNHTCLILFNSNLKMKSFCVINVQCRAIRLQIRSTSLPPKVAEFQEALPCLLPERCYCSIASVPCPAMPSYRTQPCYGSGSHVLTALIRKHPQTCLKESPKRYLFPSLFVLPVAMKLAKEETDG